MKLAYSARLLVLLAGAALAIDALSTTASATPVSSTVVWNLVGQAQYTPPSGILLGYLKVHEQDGSVLTIGCESGPFTPAAIDGRFHFTDQRQLTDGRGMPTRTVGVAVYSGRVAQDSDDCQAILQRFTRAMNKNRRSELTLNNISGGFSISAR